MRVVRCGYVRDSFGQGGQGAGMGEARRGALTCGNGTVGFVRAGGRAEEGTRVLLAGGRAEGERPLRHWLRTARSMRTAQGLGGEPNPTPAASFARERCTARPGNGTACAGCRSCARVGDSASHYTQAGRGSDHGPARRRVQGGMAWRGIRVQQAPSWPSHQGPSAARVARTPAPVRVLTR